MITLKIVIRGTTQCHKPGPHCWFALLALGLLAFTFTVAAKQVVFYAGPREGGVWFGRSENPLGNTKTASNLSAVIEAVRTARKTLGPDSRATIFLRGGTYQLSAPLVLSPEDSGLTITAYGHETPVISSGRSITGWSRVRGRRGWWKTEIPSVRDGKWYFRSLFVNGRRAQRARTPNAGSFFLMSGERVSDAPIQFHFHHGDIKPEWAGNPGIELVGLETWITYRLRIQSVNTQDDLVTLNGNSRKWTQEKGGGRYFIENTPDALDAPGEWYLDRKTGILTYIARPGEDMKNAKVIAPHLTGLVWLEGDLAARRPIERVTLQGLTFSYTDWQMPPDGYVDQQSAVRVRGDVRAAGATDCMIKDCLFTHLGNYAVDLGEGCRWDQIIGCEMTDLGGGGARIGEPRARQNAFLQNNSNVLTDNHIHRVGLVAQSAAGIVILQSGTNVVAHNEVDHLDYTAISVGWTWGYRKSPSCENHIEYNHLHDIGQGILSDLGGVYTLGPQPGTIVRNNLIHDVESFSYGGWGLYADEGSSDILFENNIVYNTKSGGFHENYGSNNIISNNIFADGRQWQLEFTRAEDHRSFIFANNIVYWTLGGLFNGAFSKGQTLMERNLYWNASGKPVNFTPCSLSGSESLDRITAALAKIPETTLKQWQEEGHDQGSVVADPEFVAPEKFDFTLKSNSPAFKTGFKPIDLTTVGVR